MRSSSADHVAWVGGRYCAPSEAAVAGRHGKARACAMTFLLAENVPLNKYTTFRIGGPARLLATPLDREDLKAALAFARDEALPVHVLGGGSNTLVRDGGLRGMVKLTNFI